MVAARANSTVAPSGHWTEQNEVVWTVGSTVNSKAGWMAELTDAVKVALTGSWWDTQLVDYWETCGVDRLVFSMVDLMVD